MQPSSPVFSIVVPVFNVADYLESCLDSLLGQSFADFELLAVDDGSTDGSADILRRRAEAEPRMRCIESRNQGPSIARNTGMEQARGEYLLFVDSDDLAHPRLLEICHHFLTKEKADFVAFNYCKLDADERMLEIELPEASSIPAFVTESPLPLLRPRNRHRMALTPWSHCCRRELAQRHPFEPGLLFEDFPNLVCLLRDVRRVVTLQTPLYGYRLRPGSIMRTHATPGTIAHYVRCMQLIAEAYADLPVEKTVLSRILVPEICKQVGNICFRSATEEAELVALLKPFRDMLVELESADMLRWRGHKLRRYLAYRRVLATPEAELGSLIPALSRIFH